MSQLFANSPEASSDAPLPPEQWLFYDRKQAPAPDHPLIRGAWFILAMLAILLPLCTVLVLILRWAHLQ